MTDEGNRDREAAELDARIAELDAKAAEPEAPTRAGLLEESLRLKVQKYMDGTIAGRDSTTGRVVQKP